ncbi:hypothetical protein LIER_29038 [Lithospermum erythrorhizon]|uniref:Uncharacterized protein n=1 Tax=Lithospermum erythrorhizon TaxID=34254 RepID=A0AAV3RL32_LITER
MQAYMALYGVKHHKPRSKLHYSSQALIDCIPCVDKFAKNNMDERDKSYTYSTELCLKYASDYGVTTFYRYPFAGGQKHKCKEHKCVDEVFHGIYTEPLVIEEDDEVRPHVVLVTGYFIHHVHGLVFECHTSHRDWEKGAAKGFISRNLFIVMESINSMVDVVY